MLMHPKPEELRNQDERPAAIHDLIDPANRRLDQLLSNAANSRDRLIHWIAEAIARSIVDAEQPKKGPEDAQE